MSSAPGEVTWGAERPRVAARAESAPVPMPRFQPSTLLAFRKIRREHSPRMTGVGKRRSVGRSRGCRRAGGEHADRGALGMNLNEMVHGPLAAPACRAPSAILCPVPDPGARRVVKPPRPSPSHDRPSSGVTVTRLALCPANPAGRISSPGVDRRRCSRAGARRFSRTGRAASPADISVVSYCAVGRHLCTRNPGAVSAACAVHHGARPRATRAPTHRSSLPNGAVR